MWTLCVLVRGYMILTVRPPFPYLSVFSHYCSYFLLLVVPPSFAIVGTDHAIRTGSNFWHPPGSAASKDAPDSNRYASLDINITHPIRTTQLALSRFLNPKNPSDKVNPSNPKRVVITTSIAGQVANLHTPLYTAGKHAMNGFIRSLGDLDAKLGVRVNGVAPGIIRTPLWTEHPEKLKFLDENKDAWVEPEEVAEAMIRLLEDQELGGGTVLEVGKGQTRKVAQVNDPGPSGAGHTVSNLVSGYGEVYGWLGEEGWGVPN